MNPIFAIALSALFVALAVATVSRKGRGKEGREKKERQ